MAGQNVWGMVSTAASEQEDPEFKSTVCVCVGSLLCTLFFPFAEIKVKFLFSERHLCTSQFIIACPSREILFVCGVLYTVKISNFLFETFSVHLFKVYFNTVKYN